MELYESLEASFKVDLRLHQVYDWNWPTSHLNRPPVFFLFDCASPYADMHASAR